jgi:hypothetical protein
MSTQPRGRRPSTTDATVGLVAVLAILTFALYGAPLAVILWRAAL